MYDVMLVLKSRTEVPYASYAPGHYYGSIRHLPKGDFGIERRIGPVSYTHLDVYKRQTLMFMSRK